MINLTQQYQDFLDMGDPRVSSWPMMDSPMKGLTLVVMYLGFVKGVGPAWMQDRKPFDLRYPMILYNFLLVAISAWVFLNMGMCGWFTTYSWRCEPIDYTTNPDALRMAEVGWYFYITKFIEFADTIFFVLRKKDSQISNLHVFHHSLVPLTLWFGIKYGAGGYNSIFAFLNSFVHTWMYLYYGVSAMGPAFQKYLWWKKYLTILQMVQFILVFGFFLQLTFFPTCHVSRPMLALNVAQAVIFFVLFLNFYVGSYYRRRQKRTNVKTAPSTNGHVKEMTNGDVRQRNNGIVKTDVKTANGYVKSADGDVKMANGYVKSADGDVQRTNGIVNGAEMKNGDVKIANGYVKTAQFTNGHVNGGVKWTNGIVNGAEMMNGDVRMANGHVNGSVRQRIPSVQAATSYDDVTYVTEAVTIAA